MFKTWCALFVLSQVLSGSAVVIGQNLGSSRTILVGALMAQVVSLGFGWLAFRVSQRDRLRLPQVGTIKLLSSVLCLIFVGILAILIDQWCAQLFAQSLGSTGVAWGSENQIRIQKLTTNFSLDLIAIIWMLKAFMATPVFEEILYRGALGDILRERLSEGGAALGVASVFAVLHPNSPIGAFLFSLALTFGLAKLGSLVPGMIAHGAMNFLFFFFLA